MPEELNINEPEMDIEGTICAAGDSEDLVRRLVTEGDHSQKIHDTIQRNIGHLSHILSQEPIATSGSTRLAGFQEAVQLGADFIAAEETQTEEPVVEEPTPDPVEEETQTEEPVVE